MRRLARSRATRRQKIAPPPSGDEGSAREGRAAGRSLRWHRGPAGRLPNARPLAPGAPRQRERQHQHEGRSQVDATLVNADSGRTTAPVTSAPRQDHRDQARAITTTLAPGNSADGRTGDRRMSQTATQRHHDHWSCRGFRLPRCSNPGRRRNVRGTRHTSEAIPDKARRVIENREVAVSRLIECETEHAGVRGQESAPDDETESPHRPSERPRGRNRRRRKHPLKAASEIISPGRKPPDRDGDPDRTLGYPPSARRRRASSSLRCS